MNKTLRLIACLGIVAVGLVVSNYNHPTLPDDQLHIWPAYTKVAALDDPTRADFQLSAVTFGYGKQRLYYDEPYKLSPTMVSHLISKELEIKPHQLEEIAIHFPNDLPYTNIIQAIKLYLFTSASTTQTFKYRLTNGRYHLTSKLATMADDFVIGSAQASINLNPKLESHEHKKQLEVLIDKHGETGQNVFIIISPTAKTTFLELLSLYQLSEPFISRYDDLVLGHQSDELSLHLKFYDKRSNAIKKTVTSPKLKKGNPLSDPSEVEAASTQPAGE